MTRRLILALLLMAGLLLAPTGVASAQEDQCGKPVTERVGNWACYDGPAAQGLTAQAGFCNVSGCYKRYNDFKADWQSAPVVWGVGARQLGTANLHVSWQLSGTEMRAQPVHYRNSVDTRDVMFEGVLTNAAPGRNGDQVAGTFAPYLAGTMGAGSLRAWLPNGYISRDDKMWDHAQVITFSWRHPQVPGTWYAWVKSLNATTTDRQIYRFRGVDQLPASPYGGGFRP